MVSRESTTLYAVHGFQDETWQAKEALLYACRSPLEGGSELENREFYFEGDLAFSMLSGFVVESFWPAVFASVKPSVDGFSCGFEHFRDVGD